MENMDYITIIWDISDIHTVASGMEFELSDKQAMDILRIVKENHDATAGINRDTLEYNINNYLECF